MEETQTTEAKKSGMNPFLIAVIVIVVLAGIGYMLTKSNKSSGTAMKTEVSPTAAMKMDNGAMTASPSPEAMTGSDSAAPQTTTGAAMNTSVQTIDMEAGSFYFKPNVITAKKGQKIKINFHAVSMMHDFNIDELNVHMKAVKNGNTGTVEFTPTQTGTFEYYCGVGQHRKMGQVGKITVQ